MVRSSALSRYCGGVAAESRTGAPNVVGLLRLVRRHLVLISLCAVGLGAAIYLLSAAQPKGYSATAQLLFRDPQFDQALFGSQFFAPGNDPAREAATNEALVALGQVAERAARQVPGMGALAIRESVDIEGEGQSDLVRITATSRDPVLAARIANAVAQSYIRFRQDADRTKIRQAQILVERELQRLSAVQREGERGEVLRRRGEDLNVLASLQTGNAELAEPAEVPREASKPRPLRNGVLGFLLGGVVGLAGAALRESLDRGVRDPAELSELLGRPVLALVPASKVLARQRAGLQTLDPTVAEAFRILRANLLYFNSPGGSKVVLIVSAAASEGKSTTAWYLAAATAQVGNNVLLVEADLRRPSISREAALPSSHGLSMVLSGRAHRRDVVQRVDLGDGHALDLLPAGSLPPNPDELIGSAEMSRLLMDAKGEYDLVIVDAPPLLVVADAVPLLAHVDGAIAVARMNVTTRDQLLELRSRLDNLQARVLGAVANGARLARSDYYYEYAPSTSEPPSEPRPAGAPQGAGR